MKTFVYRQLLVLSSLIAASGSQAQVSPHEGWYQIEVIVFSRPLNSNEHWPEDISLSYPVNWEVLKDPEAEYQKRIDAATQKLEQAALLEAESAPVNDQQMQETVDSEPALQRTGSFDAPDLTSPEAAASADTEKAELTPQDLVDPIDLARSERYILPESDRNLNTIAKRISNRAGYDILFHEAWRQIVVGEDRAAWLLLDGGESYGAHKELEGAININVSRYLHIATNLWLTEFQINAGQSRRQWPNLPENPLARLQQADSAEQTTEEYSLYGSATGAPNLDVFTAGEYSTLDATQSDQSIDSLLSDFLEAPYLPRQIYTHKQRRRMRSSELHYLDHPRLGVLVKVWPYEVPEKEEFVTEPLITPTEASLLQ